jgi:SAM-dependent methyltransferase
MLNYRSFWTSKHLEDRYWLTDSSVDQYLVNWNIRIEDIFDKKVLEIGVGTTRATKVLARLAKEFYCCDISQVALDNAKQYTNNVYLTENLKDIPPVELVICNLVLLHCDDLEVERIINDTNLTERGLFLFQFSDVDSYELNEGADNTFLYDGSHFFRNAEKMGEIISKTNKKLLLMLDPVKPFAYGNTGLQDWHYYGGLINK